MQSIADNKHSQRIPENDVASGHSAVKSTLTYNCSATAPMELRCLSPLLCVICHMINQLDLHPLRQDLV